MLAMKFIEPDQTEEAFPIFLPEKVRNVTIFRRLLLTEYSSHQGCVYSTTRMD